MLDIQPGTTFKFNLQKENHLWFILCISRDEPIQVGIANFTTKTEKEDHSCILSVNDHEYIRHDTVVRYSSIKNVLTYKEFETLVNKNLIILNPYKKISNCTYKKIIEGAGKTTRIVLKLKELLQREDLI